MKTLADLKRDLCLGKSIKMTFTSFTFGDKPSPILNKVRYVVKAQSNCICLNEDKNATKGSWLQFPKASLLEYDGNIIKIFRPALRSFTPEEQKIIDNEPKDDKQDEIDMLSDGNTMFRRKKRYYKESGHFYLFGTEKEQGKRLTHADKMPMIEDDSIKGELDLAYEVNK